jgi:hypothetical protein
VLLLHRPAIGLFLPFFSLSWFSFDVIVDLAHRRDLLDGGSMLKKSLLTAISFLLMLCVGQAWAFPNFTQNEFTTAESLDPGMTQTGMNFTLGDHYKTFYPEIRYGLGALMEVGVKFGVTSASLNTRGDKLGALVGIDLKYQLIKEADGIPLDLAVDLGFDNTIINSSNASEVSFSTILSKSFPLTERGYKLSPYGGLEMSSLYGSLPGLKDETSLYIFGGLEWKLSQKFMMMMELKTGDHTQGGIGIRFEY